MSQCLGPNMHNKIYLASNCRPWDDLQAVTVVGKVPDSAWHQQTSLQDCRWNEICVDTGYRFRWRRALCVNTINFVQLAQSHARTVTGRISVDLGHERYFAAAAILSENSRLASLTAEIMALDLFGQPFILPVLSPTLVDRIVRSKGLPALYSLAYAVFAIKGNIS